MLDNKNIRGLDYDEENKQIYGSTLQYKDIEGLLMGMGSKGYSNRLSSIMRLNTLDNSLLKDINNGHSLKRLDLMFDQYTSMSFRRKSYKLIIEQVKAMKMFTPKESTKLEVYLEGIIANIDPSFLSKTIMHFTLKSITSAVRFMRKKKTEVPKLRKMI